MIKKKIIIIGGGAAGFFCAANLDEKKYDVLILEQNAQVLQKVKISGGGRCNVTHACFDPQELVNFYPRGQKELRSVFTKFQPGDMMAWLENRGLSLKIEADGRIFPESNSSGSIIKCFVDEVSKKNFVVKTQQNVLNITKEKSGFKVQTKSDEILADFIVFCTGSSPKSINLLEKLNFKIIPAVPSLFTFNIKDSSLIDLMGTSFAQAQVSIPSIKVDESGPLLITHWGLSGPAILKISAWKALELAKLKYQFEIVVNFLGKSLEDASAEFKKYKEMHPKKLLGGAKIFEVTNRFWQKILQISDIDLNRNLSQLTKKEVQQLVENLCEKRLRVTGKSTYKDEFVTAGGVDLKEINFKTMQAKNMENFFLAGEVLNIDAVTGGFNFQACWSEAFLIAQHLNQI